MNEECMGRLGELAARTKRVQLDAPELEHLNDTFLRSSGTTSHRIIRSISTALRLSPAVVGALVSDADVKQIDATL